MQLKRYDENIIKSKGEIVFNDYIRLIESTKPIQLVFEIETILIKHKMSLNKFISILMQYLEEHKIIIEDSNICEELLNSEDKRAYLNENPIPSELLSSTLNKYLLYRRPDIFFGNKNLLKTLNSLINYNDKLNKIREKENHEKDTFLPIIENFVKDFLNQDYSLERFCLLRNISKHYFYPKDGFYSRQLIAYNQDLYQELLTDLKLREKEKQESLVNDIYKVLAMIKENKDFDAIDFYQATKYGPLEFIETSTAILSIEDSKLIREYVNKLRCSYTINYHTNSLKTELLKEKYTLTIDNTIVETTEEVRKIVLDYLEKENIPISSIIVFQDAIRKYYKNELLESKVRRR